MYLDSSTGYMMYHTKSYVHRVVAERALGKPLPRGAVIHHVDGEKLNNDPSNLVILQSASEHSNLHHREDIAKRGGDWRTHKICRRCDTIKPFKHMVRDNGNPSGYASTCKACKIVTNNTRRKRGKISTN